MRKPPHTHKPVLSASTFDINRTATRLMKARVIEHCECGCSRVVVLDSNGHRKQVMSWG